MSFLELVLLYCIQKIRGERTVYSILHILNGKKSSQTIQDIHIFQLTQLFQLFPTLTRKEFDRIILLLKEKGWIESYTENHFLLMKNRRAELNKSLLRFPFPTYLNGWKHHPYIAVFWPRLSLFVQVASNLSVRNTRYIPVQRNISTQNWLKETLATLTIERDKLNENLYKELIDCLNDDTINPNLLVCRLTGMHFAGLTVKQAAEENQMDSFYFHMCFTALLHYMIEKIMNNKLAFPLLANMINNEESPYTLTISTKKTYEFVKKGYSIEEISLLRHLKISTIEDHMVEITLNIPGFSISEYVHEKTEIEIVKILKTSSSRSLKSIKEKLVGVTYFEIRMVLAKLGETN